MCEVVSASFSDGGMGVYSVRAFPCQPRGAAFGLHDVDRLYHDLVVDVPDRSLRHNRRHPQHVRWLMDLSELIFVNKFASVTMFFA